MFANGIALQRMSLAAIIIAMGMLVDNAIVVSDSALVNMQRGMRKRIAIMRACSSTALPLPAGLAISTGGYGYRDPHVLAHLLFTAYHGRITFILSDRDRSILDVQLGVRAYANPILHPRVCTAPQTGRVNRGIILRKIL